MKTARALFSDGTYNLLRKQFATFSDYVPELQRVVPQVYSFNQSELSGLLHFAKTNYAGQLGLPQVFNSDPRSAIPIASVIIEASTKLIRVDNLNTNPLAPEAYTEESNWSLLQHWVVRYPKRSRESNISGSHCFSFLYGGPATPFVKTCLALMLVGYFATINAPAPYLDVTFWLPIILIRASSEREIIRIFIAFRPGFMAAGIFNALYNKCLEAVDVNTPMRLALGRCRCRVCLPNCDACGQAGHTGDKCPNRRLWKSWKEQTSLCCFCGKLQGGSTGHSFLHCRAIIEVSDPKSTKGCSFCGHYSHDMWTCPTGRNADGSYSAFTAMLQEFEKHPGWQIVRGAQDLSARIATPQYDVLSIADTNTFPVTPERSSPASSVHASITSSSSTLSCTPSREQQLTAIRDAVAEALTPLQNSIAQLQTGFMRVSSNVNLIAQQVDMHHGFLEALQQSGQLQLALQSRQAANLLPPPPATQSPPVEEPMPPGTNE